MLLVLALLILLGVANGTPVLLRLVLGTRYAWPLDGGLILRDGYRLFGASKTWRGIAASLAATALCAWILGYSPALGAGIAATAMGGDLLSSFIKRRLGLVPSHDVHGLDQIPESLFPALLFRQASALSWPGLAILMVAFYVLDVVLMAWMRRFEARRKRQEDNPA